MALSKAITMVSILWITFALQLFFFDMGVDLTAFGLAPRDPVGAIGIITCVFLHGNLLHLVGNSLSLLIVLTALCTAYHDRHLFLAIGKIILLSGLLVWIMGRGGRAIHIGASGLFYGLIAYAFVSSIRYRKTDLFLISSLILLVSGQTLLEGVLTIGTIVSWEFHLMGAISGIMLAIFEDPYTPLSTEKGDSDDQAGPHSIPSEGSPPDSGVADEAVGDESPNRV